jgi:hypothetical protein
MSRKDSNRRHADYDRAAGGPAGSVWVGFGPSQAWIGRASPAGSSRFRRGPFSPGSSHSRPSGRLGPAGESARWHGKG